jgi:transcription termination/antitermination protein NusA
MKGSDLLRIVDQMHHEKNIDRNIIFEGIEAALQLASEKKYGEESGVKVTIDRDSGQIVAKKGEEDIDPSDLGRIAAQSAKQVMIQKIREAECNAVFDEYSAMKGDLVNGLIARHEGGAAIVTLGKTEALLPRSEQIPGETHHVGERIKAVILDVRKVGHRVKIILSRTHPDFVRQLFENEIPEIADRTIEIKAISREAGYRAKIAVSSIDLKVDCVGACVGVRGSRIKNVVDELGGERIDIVRWNDSLQVMIPNALQPATIEEVFLYVRLGRAVVLVKEDQLSLAIGRRGQNVRLASKLVGWDIEIMTLDELNEGIERAEDWFKQIPGVEDAMVERFIEEGFLSYDDLTFLEPSELGELIGVTEDQAQDIIDFAEDAAERVEEENRIARETAAEEGRTLATRGPSPVVEAPKPVDTRTTFDNLFAPDPVAAEPAPGAESATATEPMPDVVAEAATETAASPPEPEAADTPAPTEPAAEQSPP